jgi:hypothetical protein
MTKPAEVQLIHKVVNGFHYFLGGDEWSKGLIALDEDYDVAKSEAMTALRHILRHNHNIRCGEWELFD